ncbi:MAG: Dabb family protein, partial [Verrucomicrobia bacterium]|nr:Dabb family protein [Verrucomicrobiota bacterium]
MLTQLLILTALLAMTFGCTPKSDFDSASSDATLLRHVVLFKFKDEASEAQVNAIVEAFGNLPSKIPSVVEYQWGTDVSIEGKANGFTHCFLVTFANEAGRDVYLPHTAHKEFVELLLPSLDKGTVVDFFATDSQGVSNTEGKLRHVVLFDFKEGTTEESLKAIETKFTSLPGDIPEIAAYEWGTDN